jgi:hypothetical protein
MITLTCNFYFVAALVPTCFSAVFFPGWYIAQTWYVRALFCLLIRHYDSTFRASTVDVARPLYQPEWL